jgi:hypothetical protein
MHLQNGDNTTQYTNKNNTVIGGKQINMIVCVYNSLDSFPTGFCPRVISHDKALKCCDTVLAELNTATIDMNSDGHGTFSDATSVTTCKCVSRIRFNVE